MSKGNGSIGGPIGFDFPGGAQQDEYDMYAQATAGGDPFPPRQQQSQSVYQTASQRVAAQPGPFPGQGTTRPPVPPAHARQPQQTAYNFAPAQMMAPDDPYAGPEPPAGRFSAFVRQPPSWQSGSLGQVGGGLGAVADRLLSIGVAAGAAYMLSGKNWQASAATALMMMGAASLSSVVSGTSGMGGLVASAAFGGGGGYWLYRLTGARSSSPAPAVHNASWFRRL